MNILRLSRLSPNEAPFCGVPSEEPAKERTPWRTFSDGRAFSSTMMRGGRSRHFLPDADVRASHGASRTRRIAWARLGSLSFSSTWWT